MSRFDDQMQEAAAWAIASERLDRPQGQIAPEELTGNDWMFAQAAMDAIEQRIVVLDAEEHAVERVC